MASALLSTKKVLNVQPAEAGIRNLYFMEKPVHLLLKNLEILPELGRQRCFELGNPFYYQDALDAKEPGNEQGNYWRKELPSGELFLVTLQVIRPIISSPSVKISPQSAHLL